MAAEVARLPSVPHTPANEWANDTTMSLRSTIANNTIPGTDASSSSDLNSTLAQPPTPGLTMSSSEASTPGRELPGGWGAATRDEYAEPERSNTTIYEGVSSVLSTVGQTAYNMIPSSLKNSVSSAHTAPESKSRPTGGVGDLPGPAAETSVAKLPLERQAENQVGITESGATDTIQSMVNTANPALDSLKSSVSSNAPERKKGLTRGVDDLPGPAAETSVENQHSSTKPGVFRSMANTASSVLDSTTQNISNAANVATSQIRGIITGNPESRSDESSDREPPPTTVPTTTGAGAGVGDLPGAASETSVAKLPLEREVKNKKASAHLDGLSDQGQSETDFHKHHESASPMSTTEKSTAAVFMDRRIPTPDPEKPSQTCLIPDPTLDEHRPSAAVTSGVPESETAQRISTDRDVKNAANKSGGINEFSVSSGKPYEKKRQAIDSGVPASPPKDGSKVGNTTMSKFSEQVVPPPEHLVEHGHGHNRTGSSSSSGSASRSRFRFRDKIKGEMKVLSGKVTKNEAKVEEGRAILAGDGGEKNTA